LFVANSSSPPALSPKGFRSPYAHTYLSAGTLSFANGFVGYGFPSSVIRTSFPSSLVAPLVRGGIPAVADADEERVADDLASADLVGDGRLVGAEDVRQRPFRARFSTKVFGSVSKRTTSFRRRPSSASYVNVRKTYPRSGSRQIPASPACPRALTGVSSA